MDKLQTGKREKGFTLIEIVISLAITSLVMIAVYGIFNVFFKQTVSQNLILEAQQNARAGVRLAEKDLIMIGYRIPSSVDAIETAEANKINFRYVGPGDDSDSAADDEGVRIEYGTVVDSGITYMYKRECSVEPDFDPDCSTDSADRKKVIGNLIDTTSGLVFKYYDEDGNETADTAEIRLIRVSIKAKTASVLPTTGTTKTVEVRTEIKVRNLGIQGSASDTDGPAQPSDLQVREVQLGTRTGICGQLKLRWTKGTDGDLAGYYVYYSIGGITTKETVTLSELDNSDAAYYSYTLTGLNSCQSDGDPVNNYSIWVVAYDYGGNISAQSNDPGVSNNPATSNADFSVSTQDTTINPSKPAAPTVFTSADGASDNQLSLSWSYDTTNNPDVIGFRLYRSTSPFTVFPVVAGGDITQIAGAPGEGFPDAQTLSFTDTTFTDTGFGTTLVGCSVYYYAIAPVTCDSSLISATDAVENGNNTRYIAGDYAATCGDGSSACSAGTGFASVTGSDTSPPDNTGIGAGDTDYPYPGLAARPGWKRVYLQLNNPRTSGDAPVDADFSHTFIAYKVFPSTTSCEPNCYPGDIDSDGTVTDGSRVPDRNITDTSPNISGKFTASGQPAGNMFFFDSLTQESASPPALPNQCPDESGIPCTYYFKAISFDQCGNPSQVTAFAQPLSTLCGDDPDAVGAPGTPSGLSVSGCSNPLQISWNDQSSTIDFAGYTVSRGTSNSLAASTSVTGTTDYAAVSNYPNSYWPDNSNCPWGCNSPYYEDTGISGGQSYYYFVRAMDCAYANDPLNDTLEWSGNISSALSIGPITPGEIGRDEKCPGGGSCAQDDHREVNLGVSISADNSTLPVTSPDSDAYQHNTVTLYLENTSAGNMLIQGLTLKWVNSSAFLNSVSVGGGRSGLGVTTTSGIPQGATANIADTPYTRSVTDYDLSDATVPGGARYVPITFTFLDVANDPIDMREDEVQMTLNVENQSTGSDSCISYLTNNGAQAGVILPLGPSISQTQQDKPSDPTFAYIVPGISGLNTVPSGADGPVVVGSGAEVTVKTSISSNTTGADGNKIAISSATIYYTDTDTSITSAPSDLSSYAPIIMSNIAGDVWSGDIPANDGQRIWYYVVSADADGNYDRDPEPVVGFYTYDQDTFDVCNVTPNQPTDITADVDGTDVELSWTAPSEYTSGGPIDTGVDAIRYKIYRDGVEIATNVAVTTYGDNGLTDGVIYQYYVLAYNSCPNQGDNSSTVSACVGASGLARLNVSPSSIYRGESYDVTIDDCLAVNGARASTVEVVNSSSGFLGFTNTSAGSGDTYNPTITETGAATGRFDITIGTASDSSDSNKLYVSGSDTITVFYPFANPATRTVTVLPNPCDSVPKAPATLTSSVTGSGSGTRMNLTWGAVAQNTDNSAITDLSGYEVWEKEECTVTSPSPCTAVGQVIRDWFLRDSVSSSTTTGSYSVDGGALNRRKYTFKVSAKDTCSSVSGTENGTSITGNPIPRTYSPTWNETN